MIDSKIIVMLSYGELLKHFIKISEIKFHPRGNPWLLRFHFIVFGGARNIKSFCCRLKWAYGMENGRQKCTREWRSWQLGINNDASGGNSILRSSGKVAFVENTDWCGLPWKTLGNLSVAGNGTKKPKAQFYFTFFTRIYIKNEINCWLQFVVVFVLLKLVLKVPLCDPVFVELLEFVLLGDAAVGTRCPYCKRRRKERHISSTPRHNGDHSEIHQSSAFVIDSTWHGDAAWGWNKLSEWLKGDNTQTAPFAICVARRKRLSPTPRLS